jgi:hypothetical protein
MIFKNKNIYILCVFLILILSSCQRRYWFRDFVWSSAKNDELANIKIVNETPQVLDAEFEKEIYKTAVISILFDYYKKYKAEGLNIPDNIKSHTKTYLASESIKKFINDLQLRNDKRINSEFNR